MRHYREPDRWVIIEMLRRRFLLFNLRRRMLLFAIPLDFFEGN